MGHTINVLDILLMNMNRKRRRYSFVNWHNMNSSVLLIVLKNKSYVYVIFHEIIYLCLIETEKIHTFKKFKKCMLGITKKPCKGALYLVKDTAL